MHKTFQQALHFTQPDIIVYLGDLLDEGNIANTESYNNYVHRFHNIFESDNVKSIHIPGDNDIGGENGEYILNSNVRRFEIEFSNGDIFEYKDRIRFFKINKMTLDISNPEENTNVDKIRIGISHLPILQPGGPLQRKILNEINPHILFTAHWHDSRIYVYPSTNSILFQENTIKVFDIKAYKDDNTYLEIMVPTSSYRMGKPKMGYGFALLEDNINDSMIFLKFSVLWSPSRFYYLKIYLVWLCLMGVYFVSRKCISKYKRKNLFNYIKL